MLYTASMGLSRKEQKKRDSEIKKAFAEHKKSRKVLAQEFNITIGRLYQIVRKHD